MDKSKITPGTYSGLSGNGMTGPHTYLSHQEEELHSNPTSHVCLSVSCLLSEPSPTLSLLRAVSQGTTLSRMLHLAFWLFQIVFILLFGYSSLTFIVVQYSTVCTYQIYVFIQLLMDTLGAESFGEVA